MTIFRALGAKVELFHEGIMELDDFVKLPRTVRDILVSVIVPKETEKVVYLSQRNQSTDFPVLTCAVSKGKRGTMAVIGATPYMAEPVYDSENILYVPTDENIERFAEYVAQNIRFGSNMRASAEYRKIICNVLVKRALKTIVSENEKEEIC